MNEASGFFSESEIADLRNVFFAQSHEILENLQDALLRLEETPDDAETLKAVKRFLHTLKGDANSVGLTAVGALCHRVEDFLSAVFSGTRIVGGEAVEILYSAADIMGRLIAENERGTNGTRIEGIMSRIGSFLRESVPAEAPETPAAGPAFLPENALTEYQALQAQEALGRGSAVYELDIAFHPQCRERGVAALMLARGLGSIGQIIASFPDRNDSAVDTAERIAFLVASSASAEEIARTVQIPGVTGEAGIALRKQRETQKRDGAAVPAVPDRPAAEFLRVEAAKVDRIMNLVGELIIGRSMIEQISQDAEDEAAGDIAKRLASATASMSRTVADLQMLAMKLRMVPVNQVFRKFHKLVRDMSIEKGKPVRLDIRGKETELDKSIVDALAEPLAHLIRNAIDHGIEETTARTQQGKPGEAVITLSAFHEAARVVIEVTDDGRGIDLAKLRERAALKGFVSPDEAGRMTDQEATGLIFCAGLSTADTVTGTSGRGVGMDAVKAAIEALKGVVEVESAPAAGTTFRFRLPLTLAVIKALMVEVGGRSYAIPISMVGEITKVPDADLTTVDGREVFLLRNRIISVVRLQDLFGHGSSGEQAKTLVVLGGKAGNIGLLVDRLANQQELVIKALDADYTRSDLVSGASILGSGRVVLILDVLAVFRKATEIERLRIAGAGA